MEIAPISKPPDFSNSRPRPRRTRDGCWNCRSRKKKCGSETFPCPSCVRLGLKCERETRLIWEDDARRAGMKRRGPQKQSIEGKSPQRGSSNPSQTASRTGELRPKSVNRSGRPPRNVLSKRDGAGPSHHTHTLPRPWGIPAWPFELDEIENKLLDHYIQRFSREYPACSGPANPFLRIFLPLSMQSRTVLDAMLALSGVQSWENGSFLFPNAMLKLRQRALKGCVEMTKELIAQGQPCELIHKPAQSSPNLEMFIPISSGESNIPRTVNFLRLLASCVLLLLYEKLAGEGDRTGSPHLHFFARVVPNQLVHATASESGQDSESREWSEAYHFFSNLFFYNDLVQSTSLGTPTLSNFYLSDTVLSCLGSHPHNQQQLSGLDLGRFYFPHLIARISRGDLTVTDTEIAAWDGRLDWFPSFSLLPQPTRRIYQHFPIDQEQFVLQPDFRDLGSFIDMTSLLDSDAISELYRVAAAIYRKQRVSQEADDVGGATEWDAFEFDKPTLMGNLPSWATQLIGALTTPSPYDNTLLWPIGIIAKELTANHQNERDCVIAKLEALERRFKMKNFWRVREHLIRSWTMRDIGLEYEDNEAILFG
ncbi:fungal-specific transcription factor domain-containing protein [Mariannaea sp. PMI_226]|nr:fungal-specific transcription factor domain-containing protein [Mariannaea sp. PMI_226]